MARRLGEGGNIQTTIDATIGTLGRLVGAKLLRPRDQMMRQYRQSGMTLATVKGPVGVSGGALHREGADLATLHRPARQFGAREVRLNYLPPQDV